MNKTYKGTILIVEDDEGLRKIYKEMIESDGYQVFEAGDGEKGLELAFSEKPSLILLDLNLPKIHGFEVLEKVRADEETREIPVIVASVLGEKKNIQRGLELGANDYLVKGFYSPRDILSKIHQLLKEAEI